jgi:hypothetical protein
MTREDPTKREHETYEKDHWETAHIERVDKVFATGSPGMEGADARVRVDMDGFGHGGASLHESGINIQTSHFMPVGKAIKLKQELTKALGQVTEAKPQHRAETRDLDHLVLPNGVSIRRGTRFLVRQPFEYESQRDENLVYPSGMTFSIDSLEFSNQDIQVGLDGAPHAFLEYEALLQHLNRDEIVIVETRD